VYNKCANKKKTKKQKQKMPCPPGDTCAHAASSYLSSTYPELNAGPGADMRNVGGILRCNCGLVLRAKELRDWASKKGSKVASAGPTGLYLVYEQRNSDGQGHVYVKHNGSNHGNGLYNWDGANTREFYKLA
jgi:hypothetical protein